MPVELTRQELGRLLAERLATSPSPKELADWAHLLYLDCSKADGVVEPLMTLIAMDEGPEFVLSQQELSDLAADLGDSP